MAKETGSTAVSGADSIGLMGWASSAVGQLGNTLNNMLKLFALGDPTPHPGTRTQRRSDDPAEKRGKTADRRRSPRKDQSMDKIARELRLRGDSAAKRPKTLTTRAGDCDTAPTALSALNACDTVFTSDFIQTSSTIVSVDGKPYVVIPLAGVALDNVPAALLLRPIDQLTGGALAITHADGQWQTRDGDILIKAASPDYPLGAGLHYDDIHGRLCFSETTPATDDLDRAHLLDVSQLQPNTTVSLADLTTTVVEAESAAIDGFASRITSDAHGNLILTHNAWTGFTYVSKDGWAAHYQSTDPQPGGINLGGSEAALLSDGRIAVPFEHDVVIINAPIAAGNYTFDPTSTEHIIIHGDDAASRRAYSVSTLGQVRGDTGPIIAVTAGDSATGKSTTYLIDSSKITGDIDLTTLTPGDGVLIHEIQHGRNPNFLARSASSVGEHHWVYTKADTGGGEICLVQHGNGTVTANVCIDYADTSVRDAQLVSNGTDTWLLITDSNGKLTLLDGEYLEAFVPPALVDEVTQAVNTTLTTNTTFVNTTTVDDGTTTPHVNITTNTTLPEPPIVDDSHNRTVNGTSLDPTGEETPPVDEGETPEPSGATADDAEKTNVIDAAGGTVVIGAAAGIIVGGLILTLKQCWSMHKEAQITDEIEHTADPDATIDIGDSTIGGTYTSTEGGSHDDASRRTYEGTILHSTYHVGGDGQPGTAAPNGPDDGTLEDFTVDDKLGPVTGVQLTYGNGDSLGTYGALPPVTAAYAPDSPLYHSGDQLLTGSAAVDPTDYAYQLGQNDARTFTGFGIDNREKSTTGMTAEMLTAYQQGREAYLYSLGVSHGATTPAY